MPVHGEHAGAARVRRERKMRSFWRHEQNGVLRNQRTATRSGGEESEMKYTATFRKSFSPKDGFCGTLWDICPWLLLMFLCRRWWTSCRMSCSSWQRSCWWLPSRLSKCRRSCLTIFHRDVGVATRSWWNSWWKFRRPCLTLRYSGLWSSTSTFQFLVVEDQALVFKVFFQDSVLQRRLPENAFLSGLWSRSSIFPVEAFKIFAQDRVHPLLRTFQLVLMMLWMRLVMVFFALFPKIKKCEIGFALGVGTAPRVEPIHPVSSAPCSSQAVGHGLG